MSRTKKSRLAHVDPRSNGELSLLVQIISQAVQKQPPVHAPVTQSNESTPKKKP